MLIDQTLLFDGTFSVTTGLWTGAAVFSNGTSVASTNVVDLTNARDLGTGRAGMQIAINVIVTTAFTGGTSCNFQFQGSTDSTTWTTYAETGAIAVASLALAAHVLRVPVPARPSFASLPRYWRLNYTCVGNVTAGSVIAFIAPDDQLASTAYPSGFTLAA